MFGDSIIEISESAYKNNLDFLRHHILKEGVQFSSVVKGNAYGHGIESFVPMAKRCGVKHFSVFNADEAYRVKSCGADPVDLMIMGMVEDEALDWAVEHGVSFFVFNYGRLERALTAAKRVGRPARVHIELETGMNRTGVGEKELDKVAELLGTHRQHLDFEGLCTHFAGAESISNYLRIMQQKSKYRKLVRWFKSRGLKPTIKHTACSAASVRLPEMQLDLARIGIMQYGFWPSPEVFIEYRGNNGLISNPLRRLISWKSKVMDIKEVKTGEYIGYGTSYLASNDMTIATVPIGYAHGFSRSLSNHGRVLIGGERTQVVGTVNMNAIMVDVSQISRVERGDEVVIVGKQGDSEVSVASFSDFSNQINYELLSRFSESIPRCVVP